jgi:hypothetical protein
VAQACVDQKHSGRLMAARHRLLRTALRHQGGFSPELETWISCIAAVERARSRDVGSADSVIAELEGLLALEPLTTGDPETRASSAQEMGSDQYVRAPLSTLMHARDLLECLSRVLEDQENPSPPQRTEDAGPAV